jgi:predicted nucleic acid-binding protein
LIGWLLDTNVVSELNKRSCARPLEAWFLSQPEERLFLSVLTLGELDKGIFLLDRADPRRARLAGLRDALEARFDDRILPVSRAVASLWGEISARVKTETGHPPLVVDTLLAATAIERGLYLATRNTKDVARTGAALFNPWADDPAGFPLES